jgi:hypothetical protein
MMILMLVCMYFFGRQDFKLTEWINFFFYFGFHKFIPLNNLIIINYLILSIPLYCYFSIFIFEVHPFNFLILLSFIILSKTQNEFKYSYQALSTIINLIHNGFKNLFEANAILNFLKFLCMLNYFCFLFEI